jgi:tetratricopeptide (TPR) repeat protein
VEVGVPGARNIKYYLAASAALAALVAYIPALQNDFVNWDDAPYVYENPHIRSLDSAFFEWAFFDFHSSNWHPLTWISHALDYAFWGLNPLGHHLTSIILHAINTFLVVVLIIRLLEAGNNKRKETGPADLSHDRRMLIAAGVTGLLFGLHPLHVESVAWIAERKDLLCALFFLLSVITYATYVGGVSDEAHRAERKEPTQRAMRFALCANRHYLLTLGFFALALLSKPMAVTLPVVLLILDWHPFDRIRSFKTIRPVLVEKAPFIALSLGSSIVTLLAQKAGGAMASVDFIPLSKRVLVAAASLVEYLWKTVWPFNLVPFYPYPKTVSLLSWEYFIPVILALGITAACLIAAGKRKLWPAAWGYYVVTLLPVIGLVQVGNQSMADRYMYLPSLGPFLVIGLGAAWSAETAGRRYRGAAAVRYAGIVAAVAAVVFLSQLTREQTGRWKNSLTLWSYVIEKDPERVPLAYYNRGEFFDSVNRVDEALADYKKAVALDPYDHEAYNNMGILYGKAGQLDKAIELYTAAIKIDPRFAEAYSNRGLGYVLLGRHDEALEDLNKALALNQNMAEAYYNRGIVFFETGRKVPAIADFQKSCDRGHDKACTALHNTTRESGR